jgi:hypothetical protein
MVKIAGVVEKREGSKLSGRNLRGGGGGGIVKMEVFDPPLRCHNCTTKLKLYINALCTVENVVQHPPLHVNVYIFMYGGKI